MNDTLLNNKAKFVMGETPDYVPPGSRSKHSKPPLPTGTDPPPSKSEIFDRHAEYLAKRGPKSLVQTHGNRKVHK